MKTYKITLSTNAYQASRNAKFPRNKTTITCLEGLSFEKAKAKLQEFANEDYEFSREIDTLEDFVKEFVSNPHYFENIDTCALSEDQYFEATKKRQLFLYEKKQDRFFKFEGPGLYENGNQVCDFSNNCYEHDGYYCSIVEETEENNG